MSSMAVSSIKAAVTLQGLVINDHLFSRQVGLTPYIAALGSPSNTIDAGPPAPVGHRNNQVHVFDPIGIYVTDHHASRLIESVNFIFDAAESPFPIAHCFGGSLEIAGLSIHADMSVNDLDPELFNRDLPGEYSRLLNGYWIGISALGRRRENGRRERTRRIVRVSVCFLK
jgi:hypothetical protein